MDATAPREVSDQVDQRRVLLHRITSSKTFHRSARLRDLLLDIGEHTLAGQGDDLSEQAIGVRVFGREQGYSAADDNIVRASVRQVRLKLKEYFDTEGQDEPWVLEIPKGGYVAVFTPRPASATIEVAELPASPPALWRRWPVIAAVGLVMLIAASWFLVELAHNRPRPETPTIFTTLLAQNNDPVRLVLTDSALVIMYEMTHDLPTLEEYTSRRHVQKGAAGLDPEVYRLREFTATRQITSLADVLILSRIYQENAAAAKRIEVRYARHMQPRDFKSGNFIITGSTRSNPWSSLFDSSLNFQFDFSSVHLRNTVPKDHEPTEFQIKPDGTDYARIALARNLSGNGFVLLIAGVGAEGTEGGGEFLLRGDSLELMRHALGLGPRDAIPPSEFVLEVKTLQGTARSATIVAARRH